MKSVRRAEHFSYCLTIRMKSAQLYARKWKKGGRLVKSNGLMRWTIGVVKFKRRTLPWRFARRVVLFLMTFVQLLETT